MTITIVNAHHFKGKQLIKSRTISRPSPLGNPYRVSSTCTREHALTLYKAWMWKHIKQNSGKVFEELIELRDRYLLGEELILSCWCKPLPCHGDIVAAAVLWLAEEKDKFQLPTSLKVGDKVTWNGSFPHLSFLQPFEIWSIESDIAQLKWIATPVNLSDLRKIDA